MPSARLRFNRAEKAFEEMFRPKGDTAKVVQKLSAEIEGVSEQINIAEKKRRAKRITSKPTAEDLELERKSRIEERKNQRMLDKQNERARLKLIQQVRRERERNQFVNSDEMRPVEAKRKEKVFETRKIDTSVLVPLRLDKNTVIYVKPDADKEAIIEKFKKRHDSFRD